MYHFKEIHIGTKLAGMKRLATFSISVSARYSKHLNKGYYVKCMRREMVQIIKGIYKFILFLVVKSWKISVR